MLHQKGKMRKSPQPSVTSSLVFCPEISAGKQELYGSTSDVGAVPKDIYGSYSQHSWELWVELSMNISACLAHDDPT